MTTFRTEQAARQAAHNAIQQLNIFLPANYEPHLVDYSVHGLTIDIKTNNRTLITIRHGDMYGKTVASIRLTGHSLYTAEQAEHYSTAITEATKIADQLRRLPQH